MQVVLKDGGAEGPACRPTLPLSPHLVAPEEGLDAGALLSAWQGSVDFARLLLHAACAKMLPPRHETVRLLHCSITMMTRFLRSASVNSRRGAGSSGFV